MSLKTVNDVCRFLSGLKGYDKRLTERKRSTYCQKALGSPSGSSVWESTGQRRQHPTDRRTWPEMIKNDLDMDFISDRTKAFSTPSLHSAVHTHIHTLVTETNSVGAKHSFLRTVIL